MQEKEDRQKASLVELRKLAKLVLDGYESQLGRWPFTPEMLKAVDTARSVLNESAENLKRVS